MRSATIYKLWRPSPLHRAHSTWNRRSHTPARIYYKYEGVSPVGSHKPNTAVAQAYYNKTGRHDAPGHRDRRGPVGQRPGNGVPHVRHRLQGLHGEGQLRPEALPPLDDAGLRRDVFAEPQPPTRTPAASILAEHPDSPGSLGIAISEAVEDAATHADTNYALGQRAEPRAAAPDGDRPEAKLADGDGRRLSRRRHRLLSAAAAISPDWPSHSCADKLTGKQPRLASSPSSQRRVRP